MIASFRIREFYTSDECFPEVLVEREPDDDTEEYGVATDILHAIFNSDDFDVISVGEWESWGNWESSRTIMIEQDGYEYEVRLTSIDIAFMAMYGYVTLNVYVPLS